MGTWGCVPAVGPGRVQGGLTDRTEGHLDGRLEVDEGVAVRGERRQDKPAGVGDDADPVGDVAEGDAPGPNAGGDNRRRARVVAAGAGCATGSSESAVLCRQGTGDRGVIELVSDSGVRGWGPLPSLIGSNAPPLPRARASGVSRSPIAACVILGF